MKPLIFALSVVFALGGLSAQTPAWQPSPGHMQVPIWPGGVPDAQPDAAPENDTTMVTESLVAGRPWVQVGHVSRPTMAVYAPKEKNTGAAVVVFPGGGCRSLERTISPRAVFAFWPQSPYPTRYHLANLNVWLGSLSTSLVYYPRHLRALTDGLRPRFP
jgi:hypothetical protein